MTQTLWPDHCVMATPGAMFHPGLETGGSTSSYGRDPIRGRLLLGLSGKMTATVTGLDGYLQALGAGMICICGLATDYCVHFSAMDAVAFGFRTTVIIDACRGIDVPPGAWMKQSRS